MNTTDQPPTSLLATAMWLLSQPWFGNCLLIVVFITLEGISRRLGTLEGIRTRLDEIKSDVRKHVAGPKGK